jgi:hypothetical protein
MLRSVVIGVSAQVCRGVTCCQGAFRKGRAAIELAPRGVVYLAMKVILIAIVAFALLVSVRAEDLRIAKFDIQRVFDQYERTKELDREARSKISVSGPRSYTPAMERRDTLKKRLENIKEKMKSIDLGTPAWDQIESQWRIATLDLEIDDLRATLEQMQREKTMGAEGGQQRAGILDEIYAAAALLGAERGYRLTIPVNAPNSGPFLNIIVTGPADDLTEPLLARLNEQYAAKKPK